MREGGRSVVVVGASAAGLRCACRLARLQPRWRATVVDQSPIFSYAACGLPYALSGDIPDAALLRQTPHGVTRDERYFAETKGVSVLAGWRATQISLPKGQLQIEGPEGQRNLQWDDLVLATGARPRLLPGQPDHPRVRTFHGWDDLEPLKQGLARGELGRVAIVGAGLVGCELAEAFRSLWGVEVVLLESAPAPLPGLLDPELGACIGQHMESQGVEVRTGASVEEILPDDEGVTLRAAGGETRADAVVVAVGVEPNVDLAQQAGVLLGPTGAIAVDGRLATSQPHVWAAGDCIEVRDQTTGRPCYRPFGSLANRQGRTLANVLAGRQDAFPPVTGAAAVKVFDFNVAAVGSTERQARESGLVARSAWITAKDRADYWPESREIHLKLVYEPESTRLLGVQAAGEGDAVKRIDVATQLLARGATLAELQHLEHAYAPAYAPALDPLAVAAQVAQNQEDGVEAINPLSPLEEVYDVRLPEERQKRPAPASRVRELPVTTFWNGAADQLEMDAAVVCERGTRSAEAVRLLRAQGGRAAYLGGGLLWRSAAGRGLA